MAGFTVAAHRSGYSGRPAPNNSCRGLREAYSADIDIRSYELEKFGHASQIGGAEVDVTVVEEGLVLEEDGVKVFAFEVEHRHANPAYGYRIEYGGKSVVISGDTAPSENLARHARDADVLLHEVMSPALIRGIKRRYGDQPHIEEFLIGVHTTAPQGPAKYSSRPSRDSPSTTTRLRTRRAPGNCSMLQNKPTEERENETD